MIEDNVAFAQRISFYLQGHEAFEVLNPEAGLNVVLFRGSEALPRGSAWHPDQEGAGGSLQGVINRERVMYVSPTSWAGKGAVRLAVGSWMMGKGGEAEWEVVREELERVGREGMAM